MGLIEARIPGSESEGAFCWTSVTDVDYYDRAIVNAFPVLVLFERRGCRTSAALKALLGELVSRQSTRIDLVCADIDSNQVLRTQYGIHSTPTTVLIQNGETVGRFQGVHSEATVGIFLFAHLGAQDAIKRREERGAFRGLESRKAACIARLSYRRTPARQASDEQTDGPKQVSNALSRATRRESVCEISRELGLPTALTYLILTFLDAYDDPLFQDNAAAQLLELLCPGGNYDSLPMAIMLDALGSECLRGLAGFHRELTRVVDELVALHRLRRDSHTVVASRWEEVRKRCIDICIRSCSGTQERFLAGILNLAARPVEADGVQLSEFVQGVLSLCNAGHHINWELPGETMPPLLTGLVDQSNGRDADAKSSFIDSFRELLMRNLVSEFNASRT